MGTRLIVAVGALVASLLIQLTIVNGLQLPGGGVPDLVLLCVIAVGVVGGVRCGLLAGFAAGLALDVAPPAIDLVGQYALVFCLAGYASGMLRAIVSRSVVVTLAAAAAIAVVGEALAACLSLVLGSPAVSLATVKAILPYSSLYDLVVGPLVLVAAVRLAIALGVRFASVDSLLEVRPSVRPVGLAALRGARDRRHDRRTDPGRSGTHAIGWLSEAGPTISFGPGGGDGGPPAQWRVAPGPGIPRIAFGSGGPVSAAHPPGPGIPRIAFGSGGAVSAAHPTGPGIPRIAFGAGGPVSAAHPPGPGVPRIAFGSGGPVGVRRAAGPGVPRIAFGSGGPVSAAHPPGPGIPRISFGSGGTDWHRPSGPAAWRPGVPRISFGSDGSAGARRPAPMAPRRVPGRGWVAVYRGGSATAAWGPYCRQSNSKGPKLRSVRSGLGGAGRVPSISFGSDRRADARRPAGRRPGVPQIPFGSDRPAHAGRPAGQVVPSISFGSSGADRRRAEARGARRNVPTIAFAVNGRSERKGRAAVSKVARMRAGRRLPRWVPWPRRAGGRSTVWRIGSTRTVSYR